MNILPRLIVGDSGVPYAGGESNSQGICDLKPMWYIWASLVAQLVKNLPIMQETQV